MRYVSVKQDRAIRRDFVIPFPKNKEDPYPWESINAYGDIPISCPDPTYSLGQLKEQLGPVTETLKQGV